MRGELIGRPVKVGSTEGIIIDETKNMITIMARNGMKKYIKNSTKFEFEVAKKRVIVDGSILAMKPEQRIAMKLR